MTPTSAVVFGGQEIKVRLLSIDRATGRISRQATTLV